MFFAQIMNREYELLFWVTIVVLMIVCTVLLAIAYCFTISVLSVTRWNIYVHVVLRQGGEEAATVS
jgi:hypothetical protein